MCEFCDDETALDQLPAPAVSTDEIVMAAAFRGWLPDPGVSYLKPAVPA